MPFQENIHNLIFSLTLFNFSNYWKTQSGISGKSYDDVLYTTKKMITESSKIYNDIQVYVEENTIFTNVRLSFLDRYMWMMLATDALFAFALLLDRWLFNRCNRFQTRRAPQKVHYVVPLPRSANRRLLRVLTQSSERISVRTKTLRI